MTTTATLWYVAAAVPSGALAIRSAQDDPAAVALARRMFPDREVVRSGAATVSDLASGEVGIACSPGVTVVSGDRLVFARPSTVPHAWIRPTRAGRTYYTAIGPARTWGAFAIWDRAVVRRSFSATRVHIIEDTGLPAVWERGFWAGEHPIDYPLGTYPDPRSLPFDPEVFAAEASRQWFGLDPGDIEVDRFRLDELGSRRLGTDLAGRVEVDSAGSRRRHSASKNSPIQARATPAASP